jgi:L-asparaginase / beta-aspartyl-peptidase
VRHDRYAILVHGGTVRRSSQVGDAHLDLVRSVVGAARAELAAGAEALDVVVGAIVGLEDSGLLDAGKGSLRNAAGFVETDASLMEGHTGRIGAVAAMQRIRNPVVAARIVMEKTPHVFFAGTTGEETLIGLGAGRIEDPAAYFAGAREPAAADPGTGTVGAVALDRLGHLAAGTSTGGYPGKLPGRVGDSPIIGASTFADNRVALSATGRGEYFVRRSATLDIAKRVEYQGMVLQSAVDFVVHELLGAADGIDGAVIALSRDADIVLSAANVLGVLHGFATESRDVTVGVELP